MGATTGSFACFRRHYAQEKGRANFLRVHASFPVCVAEHVARPSCGVVYLRAWMHTFRMWVREWAYMGAQMGVSGRIMGGHNCEWAQVGAHLRTRHAHPATPTCMTHARFAHGLTHKAKPHAQDGTGKRLGTTGGALGHEWATTRNTLIPRCYHARIMGTR